MSSTFNNIDVGSDSQMSSNDSVPSKKNRSLTSGSEASQPLPNAGCARARSRSKLKRKSKMRSNSKDLALAGFTGGYPKMLMTNSTESNSDADGPLPADLKAICATGLSVFPREEQQQSQSRPQSDSESPQPVASTLRRRRRRQSSSSSCSASSTTSSVPLTNKTLATTTTTTTATTLPTAATATTTTTVISSTNTLSSPNTANNNSVDSNDHIEDTSSNLTDCPRLASEPEQTQQEQQPTTTFELDPQPDTTPSSHPPDPEAEPQSESSDPQSDLPNKKRKKHATEALVAMTAKSLFLPDMEQKHLPPQAATSPATNTGSLSINEKNSSRKQQEASLISVSIGSSSTKEDISRNDASLAEVAEEPAKANAGSTNLRARSKSMYQANPCPIEKPRNKRARSVGPPSEPKVGSSSKAASPTGEGNNTGKSLVRRRSMAGNKLPPNDSYYLLPFTYGWKRELVLRNSSSQSQSTRQRMDVIFISPAGKKLRSRDDIAPLLTGELTIDHFCFQRVLQNAGEEYETMRTAQPAIERRASLAAAKQLREEQQQQLKPQAKQSLPQSGGQPQGAAKNTPSKDMVGEVVSGKRVPKPKAPKGASPPPQGWTSTMAVKGNARVLAASNNNAGGAGSGNGNSARKRSNQTPKAAKTQQALGGKAPLSQPQLAAPKTASPQPQLAVSKTSLSQQLGEGQQPKQLVENTMLCSHCLTTIMDKKQAYSMGSSKGKPERFVCMTCINPMSKALGSPVARGNKKDKEKEKEKEKKKEVIDENVDANDVFNRNSFGYQEALMELSGNSSSSLAEIAEIAMPGALPPEQLFNESPVKVLAKPQEIVVINGRKAVAVYGPPQPTQLQVVAREPTKTNLEKFYSLYFGNGRDNLGCILESVLSSNKCCQVLLAVMKTLDFHDRVRMSNVCKTWAMIGRDRSVWRTVKLRDTNVTNWVQCLRDMARNRTRELDMMGVKMANPKMRMEGDLRSLKSLRVLRTDATDADFLQLVFKRMSRLVELRTTCTSRTLNLANLEKMTDLQVLRIRMIEPKASIISLTPLQSLNKLRELCLRGVGNMNQLDLLHLKGMQQLETLLLGSCRGMKVGVFGTQVLPNLKKLRRLRVENNSNRSFVINEIMNGVAAGGTVQRLELINVNVEEDFSHQLTMCRSVEELLLMPNFIQNTANMMHYIMQAVNENSDQLAIFRLGLSFELLSVTRALAMNPDKDCIPVALPIPGVPRNDKLNKSNEPIAYLPVDRLESILHHMMPQGWLSVAKVAQCETTNVKFLSKANVDLI
ncbi:hypothetical protein KR093_003109 [Drosophila rubida]|uniref:MBD domain-containing protein n=1 Tax=Drosophila rubida TaxID=30044 RepID=A0AAD4KCI0_9MUSC|nr:hypothetical protein KR093_003109 [Drosophila rubida]